MTESTPHSSPFLSDLVANLRHVKEGMATTTIRTNNVPSLTSAVRGREAPGRGFMFPPHLMQSRGYGSSVLNPNKTWESTYFPDLAKRLKLGSDRETEIQKEAFAPALRAAMGLGRIGLKGLQYGARG